MENDTKIQQFILDNVEKHPGDIVNVVADEFGLTRQKAHACVSKEVNNGSLTKTGRTRGTRYYLAAGNFKFFVEPITPNLAEDKVWTKYVKPMVQPYPRNIYDICLHGFTEIFNNAIDHSEGTVISCTIEIKENEIAIGIIDDGVGIFNKIQRAFELDSTSEAIFHLSKGKLTTDPKNHSGEGIFFTSRMFDHFGIHSGGMYYTFNKDDWFLSPEKKEDRHQGTLVRMEISLFSTKTAKEVFDQYTDEEIGFGKTIVAVMLSADPDDPHVSRSQAKRLLMGLDKFSKIILDFKGVQSVGQAFVDQIFRVFQNEYPNIVIHYINANKDVEMMIQRGLANR